MDRNTVRAIWLVVFGLAAAAWGRSDYEYMPGVYHAAGGGGLPADGVTSLVSAFSTRKLLTSYAGSAIRVKRSSDNTELDIGFAANELDVTALTTFVGAGDGLVTVIYDQSGHGNNLAVAATFLPARIVSAGTVETLNTKPCINFYATGMGYLKTATTPTITGTLAEVFWVGVMLTTSGPTSRIVSVSNNVTSDWSATGFALDRGSINALEFENSANGTTLAYTAGTATRNYGHFLPTGTYDTNGTTTVSIAGFPTGLSGSTHAIGGYVTGGTLTAQTFIGKWAEAVITNTTQADYTVLFANQATYWGVP
jgi:hypothetical protein